MFPERIRPPSASGRATRPRSLARELAWVLLFKLVALAALWLAFFRGPAPPAGPDAMADQILAQAPSHAVHPGGR
ncbi:MAG TPA: hypothetical protein VKA48_07970 [Gammaproteobacteria bacterium]|nr:hypothetical protein [Gammaproteobacteria bacterium]